MYGELWQLCPAPDLPRARYERLARATQRATRLLVAEVRRRPRALVTMISYDAHSSRVYREEISVRRLAREHLRNPGIRRVPCRRRLMQALRDAVDGRHTPVARRPRDERVFLVEDVVRALGVRKRGAAMLSPAGCEVDAIYSSPSDLEPSPRHGEGRNQALLTDPARTVGVGAYRPTAACRAELEPGLAVLATTPTRPTR